MITETSHGRLTGGSAVTDRLAAKYGRPFLHIDLNKVNAFRAAETITDWITEHGISILNVAGPRASKDPQIYDSVKRVLITVLNLDHIRSDMPDPERIHPHLPRTVDEAVEYLMSDLDLKDKTKIAKMAEDELIYLHATLGQYVRNRLKLWEENKSLMQSCRLMSGQNLNEDECLTFVVKELWLKLRASYRLKAVK